MKTCKQATAIQQRFSSKTTVPPKPTDPERGTINFQYRVVSLNTRVIHKLTEGSSQDRDPYLAIAHSPVAARIAGEGNDPFPLHFVDHYGRQPVTQLVHSLHFLPNHNFYLHGNRRQLAVHKKTLG